MDNGARVYVRSDSKANVDGVAGGAGNVQDDESEHGQKRCRVCGELHEKLYQHQTCKKCLVNQFQRLKPVIDSVRVKSG